MINKYRLQFFIFYLVFNLLLGQYFNPYYGGAANSGFGESGGVLSGPIYGIKNPASLFVFHPRINQSVMTGQFSDFYLFIPTVKDVSVELPMYHNTIFLRGYYGQPSTNNLRFGLDHFWTNRPNTYYKLNSKRIGLSIAYEAPMTRIIKRAQYFDLRLGLDISQYWESLTFRNKNSQTQLSRYWLTSLPSDHGITAKVGSIVYISFNPKYQLSLGTVLSKKYSMGRNKLIFDQYSISLGYRQKLYHRKSLQLGIEAENFHKKIPQKLGIGFQYNFTDYSLNSLQFGFYQYPENIYNKYYKNKNTYWSTIGFTKSIHNLIISGNISDPVNLSLSNLSPPSSDFAKIISFTISVPLDRFPITKKIEQKLYPEFLDFSTNERKIVIGNIDTLRFYLKLNGVDSLISPRVYFNVKPKKGILISKPFVQIKTMYPSDIAEISVPFSAVSGMDANKYNISASLNFGTDQIIYKEFKIKTVKPQIDVISKFGSTERYIIFPIPGSYNLTLSFTNYGNYKSDSIIIEPSPNLIQYGLIDKTEYLVKNLLPGKTKNIIINFSSISDSLPPKIPFTLKFIEKNGFDPLPIHSEIVVIDKNAISFNEIQNDPFLTNFSGYHEFYFVLNPKWEDIQKIGKNTKLNMKEDPRFPGKLLIGPYVDVNIILAYDQTIKNFTNNYSIVAVKNFITQPVIRYFVSIANTDETRRKLKELGLELFYKDRQNPSLILIGPFINLKSIINLEAFFKEFFPKAGVVGRYPNQISSSHD